MQVAVVDIGKPGKNLGWFLDTSPLRSGGDIDQCVDALASALTVSGLALGFEAPMFVPVREKPGELLKARANECLNGINRPFLAGPGASVLVTALVVVPYILSRLRKKVPEATATLDWHKPPSAPLQLLLFEAFVTDQRKDNIQRHVEDAELAVKKFRVGMKDPSALKSDVEEPETFNLLGAMMLRTGWSSDPRILTKPCLVVRAYAEHKTI
jgi:hypothetical protein